MIGKQGFIRFSDFVRYLNVNTATSELEFTHHEFLPNRWCIGNTNLDRWIQLSVTQDLHDLEIDYLLEGVGHQTKPVYATELVAERVLKYLRGEATQI